MPTPADVPNALIKHRQLENASCAVSGFESIAKLHGLIAPDAFPLQSDPANQNKGFNDTVFLQGLGLVAQDGLYSPQEAATVIEEETDNGRFPLVSLIGKSGQNGWGYHVFVCAVNQGELVLIDPAKPAVEITGKAAVAAALNGNSQLNPERKTIHVLSYKSI